MSEWPQNKPNRTHIEKQRDNILYAIAYVKIHLNKFCNETENNIIRNVDKP